MQQGVYYIILCGGCSSSVYSELWLMHIKAWIWDEYSVFLGIFPWINLSIPGKINSEKRVAVLAPQCWERNYCHVRSELSQSALVCRCVLWNVTSGDTLGLSLIDEFCAQGSNSSAENFSGLGMRRSSRFVWCLVSWTPVGLSTIETVRKHWRNLDSICLFQRFCFSGITSLCIEFLSRHKYEC